MKQAEKWFQIRFDLYQHVQARVSQRVGRESQDLVAYRKTFEKQFIKKWTVTSADVLFRQLSKVDIIFLADFHALQQSQKTHLRILKKVKATRPLVLALECIEAKYQKYLDQFMKGQLSETDFLRLVRWQENWGFPWENYRPLFIWARQKKVIIYGVNTRAQKRAQMSVRDHFASQKIQALQKKHPQSQIFVIFGDLHLAPEHLPKKVLLPGTKHLLILQNSEKIYFEELRRGEKNAAEIVRLNKNSFCVLNVPPWVKWQNYLMFLEKTYDQNLDESVDYTDHVQSYAKVLSKELGLKVSLSDLSVYTAAESSFWENIQKTCTATEAEWVARLIDEESVFYLPATHGGYLPRASVNHAVGLAMEYLLFKSSSLEVNLLEMPDYLSHWIWVNGWSYFGSKIINPKRKTDTLTDIKARLTSPKGKLEREPLQVALSHKIYELAAASGRRMSGKKLKVRRKRSYIIAAELLGGLMGEKIFEAYRRNKLSAAKIRELLATPMTSGSFLPEYFKFVQFLEGIPISFQSKEEKI